jgi:hypothetical protein
MPDPYGPASAGFAERHRETQTQLPNGLVRVDLGEPAHPAMKDRPSRRPAPAAPRAAPEPAPPIPLSEHPPEPRKDHRAITRNA